MGYAVPNQSVATTARVLVEEMFCCFGSPGDLHNDKAWNFEAEVFAAVCECLGVKKNGTTLLHLQSNGLVE